jgi:hypothetical protein
VNDAQWTVFLTICVAFCLGVVDTYNSWARVVRRRTRGAPLLLGAEVAWALSTWVLFAAFAWFVRVMQLGYP